MITYICKNKECKKFDIENKHNSYTLIFKEGKLLPKDTICPECGQERDYLEDKGTSAENINIITKGQVRYWKQRSGTKPKSLRKNN